jgi:oligoribonuclease NrnB/cAMP/cGMP phosphodiesterase (DHH superfamily)
MKALEFAKGWLFWTSLVVLVPAVCVWTWTSDELANIRSVRRHKRKMRDKLRAARTGSARL